MRAAGIEGVRRTKRVRTTKPEPGMPRHPDLVGRDFTATAPNQLWVTDLTYVPTWAGVAYVCFIIDACSRMIVGWRVASHMRTAMVLDAIEMARWSRGTQLTGLRCHSDAGSQGEINWSSQHLDDGGARWVVAASKSTSRFSGCRRVRGGSGLRIGRCGRRCVRRAGRSRLVRCSGSSGA